MILIGHTSDMANVTLSESTRLFGIARSSVYLFAVTFHFLSFAEIACPGNVFSSSRWGFSDVVVGFACLLHDFRSSSVNGNGKDLGDGRR